MCSEGGPLHTNCIIPDEIQNDKSPNPNARSKHEKYYLAITTKKTAENKRTFFKATRSFSGCISCMAIKTSVGVNAGPV